MIACYKIFFAFNASLLNTFIIKTIYLGYLECQHIKDMEGVIVGGVNINNLRYADDTVLLADSEGCLQTILNEVNEAGKAFNMKMNAKKTKTMITKKDDKPRISTTIGTNIEQVTNFPYLGQKITEDGRCEEEIKRRINIAKTTFSKNVQSPYI